MIGIFVKHSQAPNQAVLSDIISHRKLIGEISRGTSTSTIYTVAFHSLMGS